MEKPFDLKDLEAKLKAAGIASLGEDGVKLVVESTLNWIYESAALSPNKVDDFAIPVLMAIKPYIMSKIDKIDGQEG